MTSYIIRRVAQSLVLLFFISMLIYVVLNLVPGGPFDMLRLNNPRITQSMIDRLNALLDLDKPLLPGKYCPVVGGEQQPCTIDQGRYVRWLSNVARGDFGNSWTMQTGTPVIEMIAQRHGPVPFFTGLALIVAGVGLLKPNISTMVGGLYPAGDPRRDKGFTIFYIGINIGALASSLIVGYIGERIGWHYGFALAGIGMLLGQVV